MKIFLTSQNLKQKLDDAIMIGIEQADRGEFSERTVQDIIQYKKALK